MPYLMGVLLKHMNLQSIGRRACDGNLVPIKIVSQTSAGIDPQFADLALSNGMPYSYRVIAVDVAGNKSEMSVEASETTVGGPEWAR